MTDRLYDTGSYQAVHSIIICCQMNLVARSPSVRGWLARFLEPNYRRPLILAELLGFHADIICLQEVDEKAFTIYFLPQLQLAGIAGAWTNQLSEMQQLTGIYDAAHKPCRMGFCLVTAF